MRNQQQGYGQAQAQLPGFARGHAQVAPPEQGMKAEQSMYDKRCVKCPQADAGLPRRKQIGARYLHGVHGADAEGMVDEVARRVGE